MRRRLDDRAQLPQWQLAQEVGDGAGPEGTIATIPTPMLKVRHISSGSIPPSRCRAPKSGGTCPGRTVKLHTKAGRQDAGDVAYEPAARDVRKTADIGDRAELADGVEIAPVGLQEQVHERLGRPGQDLVEAKGALGARYGAPASSRLCAGRSRGPRARDRPRRTDRPSIRASRSTTPTMNPATSYVAGASTGPGARPSRRRSAPFPSPDRPRPSPRRSRRVVRRAAAHSCSSRGRRAARRHSKGRRSRSG